jgi:hypothetical protein
MTMRNKLPQELSLFIDKKIDIDKIKGKKPLKGKSPWEICNIWTPKFSLSQMNETDFRDPLDLSYREFDSKNSDAYAPYMFGTEFMMHILYNFDIQPWRQKASSLSTKADVLQEQIRKERRKKKQVSSEIQARFEELKEEYLALMKEVTKVTNSYLLISVLSSGILVLVHVNHELLIKDIRISNTTLKWTSYSPKMEKCTKRLTQKIVKKAIESMEKIIDFSEVKAVN